MLECFSNQHLLVPHGFFTRKGGVSKGSFESLNCGFHVEDDSKNVQKNRDIIVDYIQNQYSYASKPKLVTCIQEHTANPFWIENLESVPPKGIDALVTNQKNILLGILTADCCPILLFEPENKIIAAVHAGWKGASLGVIENTIDLMVEKGAMRESIIAVIGPCLDVCHFEVQQDFIDLIISLTPFSMASCLEKRDNSYHFNLLAYVQRRLEMGGLSNIYSSFIDTYSNSDLFFSFRRKTHNKEMFLGRQLSVIGL